MRVIFEIEGLTTLSPGKMLESPKAPKESHGAHDERCWRERLTLDTRGVVILPPLALKKAMEAAAKMRSDTIPGKGKSTYTKHVASGIIPDFDIAQEVMTPTPDGKKWAPLRGEDVIGVVRHVPSDGKVGGGTRVPRRFPEIPAPWRVSAAFYVISNELQEAPEKLREYLELAGQQIGICRFRPGSQSAGWYGRFRVDGFEVAE